MTADQGLSDTGMGRYRDPNHARSIVEILITVVPLAICWLLIWLLADGYYWLGLLIAVPAAGLLVRLFLIQHDCGHGTLFRRRAVNDWVGRALGVLTLTPYEFWRHSHAIHHASSGNLDRRGIGDIDTLTVAEFHALSPWGRLKYRLYRHPLVMFGIGPIYLFFLRHRVAMGPKRNGPKFWVSTMTTNVAILLVAAPLIWLVGFGTFLSVQLPITILASSFGVWLFYIQHQYEAAHWERDGEWTFHEAALHGSSHYALPPLLRWFTANAGAHHVHHLYSRIPFYRFPEVLRDRSELREVRRITLRESLRSISLALWDEETRRLVSFRTARAAA